MFMMESKHLDGKNCENPEERTSRAKKALKPGRDKMRRLRRDKAVHLTQDKGI